MTSVWLRTKEFHLKWKEKESAGQRPWQTAELNKWLLAAYSDVEMESNASTIKNMNI